MRKFLILFSIISLTLSFFISCGGGSSDLKAKNVEDEGMCKYAEGQIIIDKESILGEPPAWINSKPGRGKVDGEKVIYFYGEAIHPVENVAVDNARADSSGTAAESIKQNVIKEYAKAYESVGGPGKENYEEIQKGLLATKAKVQLKGAETTGEFKAKVRRLLKVDQGQCKILKSDYATKVWVQKSIPYSYYIELRDGIVKQSPINEQQKKLLEEANKKLDELDDLDK